MCGIAGSLQKGSSEKEVELMISQMPHRGPDAGAVVALDNITLGHRRLSIIDTSSNANQPMHDHTKRFWVVLNGEIYNYKDLKKTLLQMGHHFVTESDTEVLLEAYKAWGLPFLEKLTGMYAFALWDTSTKNLLLVRDRLGEKPLYYYLDPNASTDLNCPKLIFASELKALASHPHIPKKINLNALNQFLSLNYILGDECILEGIQKLPPAHFLFIENEKSPVLKEYWSLKDAFVQKMHTPESRFKNQNEAEEELDHLLQKAIAGQMLSDVPLGAFLSGGIDSSIIVSQMTRKTCPSYINTFSIGFNEKSYSELEQSRAVAAYLGVSHHTKTVAADANVLPKIVKAMDEPFADTSMIPMYYLAEFANQSVVVALSGDGGDELFGGYETYIANKLYHYGRFIPKKFWQGLTYLAHHYMPTSFAKVSLDYKLKQFFKGCSHRFERAHYSWRTIFSEDEKKSLIHPSLHSSILFKDPFHRFNQFFSEVSDCHPLEQALYVDKKTWMVDDILVKVDRTSMAHSLEARAPFLDHHIVEFAASIPIEWKIKGFKTKHILKQSQAKHLPSSVLSRPKKGFNAPVSLWLNEGFKSLSKDITLSGLLNQWCDPMVIEKLWHMHQTERFDHGLKLFGLTCLGLWLNEFKMS